MSFFTASRTVIVALATWLIAVGNVALAAPASIELTGALGEFSVRVSTPESDLQLSARASAAVSNVSAGDALHLSGKVRGVENSWARISLDPRSDWVSGLIRHRGVLYTLERKPSGLVWLGQLDARPPESLTVSSVLPLSVVIDSAYNEANDGQGRRRALALVNQLDGLYREQIGLGVNLLAARQIADAERDPFRQSGGTLADLLLAFRHYRQIDQTLPQESAAVHLFSGAKVFDRRMGLAYIAGVCDTEGRDVSVSRTRLELVTLAHELAHSLGATHDQESSCPSDGLLMDATVSRRASLQMSNCSVAAIQAVLARGCFDEADSLTHSIAALQREGLQGIAREALPALQSTVPNPKPVSPLVLLVIAVAAVGLVRRRN